MQAKRCQYFTVDIEDRAGELFRFAIKMKEAGVSMVALWSFSVGQGRAKINALAEDSPALLRAIKGAGYAGQPHTCFQLVGADQTGALCETLDAIEGRGINLHAVDAMGVAGQCMAYVWPSDADADSVGAALGC